MKKLRRRLFAAAGYSTVFFGSGRPEFNPKKPMRPFEEYLKESADGTLEQLSSSAFDEGVVGSFMPGRFIKQANLPGFLPFMVPSLKHRPCLGVEGACGTGGRAITAGCRGILSELSDASFVAGFEIQNSVKAVYGADILAGAGYHRGQRKEGPAHFFPGIFAKRAGAYYEKYGYAYAREAMAHWYANAIINARKNPKAQEYANSADNLIERGMTPPDPETFIAHLNPFDCSKVTDGAASLALFSEEGLAHFGVSKSEAVEIIGIGEAEEDITKPPEDPTLLSTTQAAAQKALKQAGLSLDEIAVLEIHDCFTITAILAFEALGFAKPGGGPRFIMEGHPKKEGKIPTNLSGGLGGFGHPTGATGVRQLADLVHQLTGKAANKTALKSPYGMMVSMGGDDKTVTCLVVKKG